MIEQYTTAVNHYLMTNPHLGEIFAFVVAFAESLPLIGTIIPGSITMTVIGILVGRGLIPGAPTLFWATIGALAGDTIGFWIGKYYNERLRKIWPFNKYPTWLRKGEAFVEKHGGKSIVIGRFVGPVRSSVPLIAGLLKLSWGRFFLAALPSAFLWAIAYLLPGVLIGAISLELAPGATTKFVLIALAIIIFLWLIFWAIQRFFTYLAMIINRGIDKLWGWLSTHRSLRYTTRIITNHSNPSDHSQLTLFILTIISFALFLVLFFNVINHGALTYGNKPLFYFFQSIRALHSDYFFVLITFFGKSELIYPIALITVMGLLLKKQWRSCGHLLALIVIAGVAIYFFKSISHSPRPSGFVVINSSSSFPSGHTGLALTIYGFLAFLIAQQFKRKWHWIPYTVTGFLIALIALSRLYLGAHWLTDIFGSIFLDSAILLSVIISYRRYPPSAFANLYSFIFLGFALLIPWGIYASVKFRPTLHRYEPAQPVQYIDLSSWWKNPTRYLPVYRLNRFGNPIQPFNLQWAASLNSIKSNLLHSGWVLIHNETRIKTTLGRLGSPKPEKHLPVFPLLYRHMPPVLFMIKHVPSNSTIIELRLWKSGVIFKNSELPLWIGAVDYHMASQHRYLVTLKKPELISLLNNGGIVELTKNLKHYRFKKVKIDPATEPKKIIPLHWNGTILLIRPKE